VSETGDHDSLVRLAAFHFLEEQTRQSSHGGALPRTVLATGFNFEGQRVPLIGPAGIFKPRILTRIPLSITTVPIVEGQTRPYDDAVVDGLLHYRYRGSDPQHRDNVGLRIAFRQRVPLIYLHGIVPGLYAAEWPVFVVGDNPQGLTFTVSVDERRFSNLGTVDDEDDRLIRRRYATRLAQQRLHQTAFRERVIRAYEFNCAICRLRRHELLEAAHIVADSNPLGEPRVSNGLALCRLHHGAFDANLIGVTPDYTVAVRRDVLGESDGPMLIHGLQGFHNKSLQVPRRPSLRPDRDLLTRRYDAFLQSAQWC
jgi:putative restriction endonuclease